MNGQASDSVENCSDVEFIGLAFCRNLIVHMVKPSDKQCSATNLLHASDQALLVKFADRVHREGLHGLVKESCSSLIIGSSFKLFLFLGDLAVDYEVFKSHLEGTTLSVVQVLAQFTLKVLSSVLPLFHCIKAAFFCLSIATGQQRNVASFELSMISVGCQLAEGESLTSVLSMSQKSSDKSSIGLTLLGVELKSLKRLALQLSLVIIIDFRDNFPLGVACDDVLAQAF